jgi:nucleoside-diphosphate-sugar epimerase
MRVLVTGNLGYIGVVVTATLQAAGHAVVGLDADYYYDGAFEYPGQPARDDIPAGGQILKDIRDVVPADLVGIDAVVHLAALSNDPMGELDPGLTEAINYRASVDLARLARDVGARRFLFSSSCSVYGQGAQQALTEESALNPLTAYARSKVETEVGLSTLAGPDFSPVYLRNATAYGLSRMLRFDLVVNNLTGSAVATGRVQLTSDGRAWRPIVHIRDIARAFQVMLEAPQETVHNQAFNVGSEADNYQVREIATRVAGIVPGSQVTFREGASADSRNYNVSFAKIRRLLPEFRPTWTLTDGIREIAQACQAAQLTPEAFNGRRFTRLKQLSYLLESQQIDPALRWRQGAPVV